VVHLAAIDVGPRTSNADREQHGELMGDASVNSEDVDHFAASCTPEGWFT
jgi:hypothetical protein